VAKFINFQRKTDTIRDMVKLKVKNLHWITEEETERDLCAHGFVILKIGNRIVSDKETGEWAVNVAAFNLLKTVLANYDGDDTTQLIPCCGHDFILWDKTDEIVFFGCNNGIDWKIAHRDKKIIHIFDDNTEIETEIKEWAEKIADFSDEVMAFYQHSKDKVPHDHDKKAFERFMQDWKNLRFSISELAGK